jgi:hypothetical protein
VVNFAGEEDAADARHEFAYPTEEQIRTSGFAEPGDHIGNANQETGPSIEMPERGKAQQYIGELRDNGFIPPNYHPGGYVPHFPDIEPVEGMRLTEGPPMTVELSHGLTWTFAPGQKIMDLGRISAEVAAGMETLDLRVILAHLDSAAKAIQTELGHR